MPPGHRSVTESPSLAIVDGAGGITRLDRLLTQAFRLGNHC